MATPSIMRRLGDKASSYGKAVKSLAPDDNEAEGLRAAQSTIQQVSAPPEEKKEEVSTGERLNPNAKYGDKAGEKRIDTSSMTKPLGQIPIYDDGGDVRVEGAKRVNPEENKELPADHLMTVNAGPAKIGDYEPRYSEEAAVAGRPGIAKPTLPIYDEGGDVDINDGKHQMAVLQDGEKVLTPEEAAAYDKEQQGAPADFGGRVIPNPDDVKVHDDSEREPKELETPEGDTSNPAKADLGQEGMHEMSAKTDLSGQKPKLDPTSPAAKILQQDKVDAVKKGDLVGLGKAVLGENHLATPLGNAMPSNPEQPATTTPAVKSPMDHKATIADYNQKIQQALDKAAQTNDPAFQEQADRLKLAKAEYEKNTPWGSPTNHPGVLGKVGHVLGRIGNIAGDVLAPGVTSLIPGTDLNKGAQRSRLGQAIQSDTASNLAQEEEKYKENALEVGKTPEQVTFRSLMRTENPETGKLYTPDEALSRTKTDENTKEKESYVNDQMKQVNQTTGHNYTREEATEAYYQMRAGTKPPNAQERELKDYMASHGLTDNPQNRDLARVEVEKRNTTAKADAALPAAEQKIRLQSSLSEANADLNANHADALQRGKSADEFLQKENARHTLRLTQIDSAQDALDKSDTNELAASIVPVLATMTESNEQGIKRLNPQELGRFMPKSSGDAKQWFEANYDKVVSGQIPTQYRGDLRELLNNIAKEEGQQYEANKQSIDQTLRQGAVAPKVNEKGKVVGSEASKPGATPAIPKEVPAAASRVYRDAKGNVKGYALNGHYHAIAPVAK